MTRRLLINTCMLLAVTTHVGTQYVDFFANINSFLQPFTTTKTRNDVTKRPETKQRQTHKQKYQDAIFFETDDVIKQKEISKTIDNFNFFPTTTKPRRKSTKSTTTSHSYNAYTTHSPDLKPINNNKLNNKLIINNDVIRNVTNNNRETYNNNVDNNARRIDNYNGYNENGYNNYNTNIEPTPNRATNNFYVYQGSYNTNYDSNINNRPTTQRTTTANYYNNNRRQTTRKTTEYFNNGRQTTPKTTEYYNARQTTRSTTEYYNNAKQTTQRSTTSFYNNKRTTRWPSNNGGIFNSQTTRNPLLNRPGVKPAAVDENLPPITNRPVTNRPVTNRPVTSNYDRPPATFRPVNTRPTYEERPTRRPETRPVNTRSPYETQRPISSGVVRPVASRPIVSNTESSDAEPDIEIGPDEEEMSESERSRLYDICEQKCDEYKSARVKKVVALPLTPQSSPVEVNVSSCTLNSVPLIIGGAVARIQTFPHMALVGWKKVQSDGYSWKCGGSLVSEQYILTAGHCTYHDKDYNVVRYDGPPQAVQLGSALYNDRTATVVQVAVVIRHPKYKLRRSYYDVALIRLVRSVSFSDTISPACLGVPPPVGKPVVATGWGKTEFGGDSSIELRSVSFPIWDMADCREIWGTSLKLPNGPMENNQVCAGERKGAKDTCQGDSGGPAQIMDGCAWRVVAVTSVGRSCGAPDTPALYARVPRAFIASQVYTNAKPSRDGNNQYGNEGANTNNNWGSGNNNRYNDNNNASNVNNQYGNQDVHNVRPIQMNGQDYNNNGQIYSQGSSSDSSGVYNNWNVHTDTTKSDTHNQYNGNVYEQSYVNNGHNYRPTTSTTTTVKYNQNNYGQISYNSFGQIGYNNEQNPSYSNPSNVNYETSYGYNDNGRPNNGYTGNNDNGYNNYQASRPWWTR